MLFPRWQSGNITAAESTRPGLVPRAQVARRLASCLRRSGASRWPRALRRSGCASLPRAGDAQLSTVLGSGDRLLLWRSLRGRRCLPAQHGRDGASHGLRRGNEAELSAVPPRASERLHDATPWRRKQESARATRPVPHDSARCSSLRRTALTGASYRRLPAQPSGTRSHRGSEGSNPSN